jgi:uncharacterized protein YicC (UPF0701 family)
MPDGHDTPVPDPTVLTTEAIIRAVESERDYVNGKFDVLRERLNGMDTATELLSETVTRVPTDTQQAVDNLKAVVDERFSSIVTQFKERDTRSERESRDNKVAVDAAFAAQKEAASEQNKANTKAIDKSEEATNEAINKLGELFKTAIDALTDKVDDVKSRTQALENKNNGTTENRVESRAAMYTNSNVVATVVAAIVGIFVIAGVITAVAVALGA